MTRSHRSTQLCRKKNTRAAKARWREGKREGQKDFFNDLILLRVLLRAFACLRLRVGHAAQVRPLSMKGFCQSTKNSPEPDYFWSTSLLESFDPLHRCGQADLSAVAAIHLCGPLGSTHLRGGHSYASGAGGPFKRRSHADHWATCVAIAAWGWPVPGRESSFIFSLLLFGFCPSVFSS